jgi:hypothetical protein
MKPEHVVAIGLRLFAIYLSVSTINGLIASGWFYIASASNMLSSTLVVLVAVLSLGTAYLLWRFALWIALNLVRLDGSVYAAFPSMTIDEVQNIAFTVLGVYFLFRAVMGAVYWLVFFGSVRATLYAIESQQWASIAETLAEFLLASFLVFRAKGLTALISKVRQLGRENAL